MTRSALVLLLFFSSTLFMPAQQPPPRNPGQLKQIIPGHYVFHFGEEVGGIGSGNLALARGDWLQESFDYAIALDRAGTADIVTHQIGRRTASTAFARSIAGQLSGRWESAHGTYTDTAEYTDYIPECTNLSVGYGRAHTADEFVHYGHVGTLLHCLVNLDESLLCVGDKAKEEADEEKERQAAERRHRPKDRWRWTPLHRRASLVDAIGEDDGFGYLGEDDTDADVLRGVWCVECDESQAACTCGDMTDDDKAFLRYLQGFDR